jgi:hypothetical protein
MKCVGVLIISTNWDSTFCTHNIHSSSPNSRYKAGAAFLWPLSVATMLGTDLYYKLFFWRFPPKARQPLMSCISLSCLLWRTHVHTSGTKPAICLLGFYVVSCNSERPRQKYDPAHSPKIFSWENKERGMGPWRHHREGVRGGHPPWHSLVPPSPPKARAKLFSFNIYMYEVDLLMGGPNLNLTWKHLHNLLLQLWSLSPPLLLVSLSDRIYQVRG